MNTETPGCEQQNVIVIYHEDVASEVATQFCREHDIPDDYIILYSEPKYY